MSNALERKIAKFFSKSLEEFCICGHRLKQHTFPLKGGHDCDVWLDKHRCVCPKFVFQNHG